jgi:hypothetical protein
MPNIRKPFVYSLEHKMHGTPQTTATVLVNNGVHQLTGATTFVLAGPRVGSLVTLILPATMSTANCTVVSTSSSGQVAFNSLAGTQKLFLQPTTAAAGEDASVTLLGESSTQWRIVNCWPKLAADSTTNGIRVTT